MRISPFLALLALLVAGCGSSENSDRRTPEAISESVPAASPGRDCLTQWNASTNAENRARLVETGYRIGGVSEWLSEAASEGSSEEGAGEGTSGCSYLFHDDELYVSLSGHWEDEYFVRDRDQTQTGAWSPEQEAVGYSSSHLIEPDGTVRPNPDWRPPTSEELAGPLATAPRGGREEAYRGRPLEVARGGAARLPYRPLEELVLDGASDGVPAGCSARDVAGLLDHFFAAFNRGDTEALDDLFGPDLQYYVHPRNYIEQPATREALIPFLVERQRAGEQMLLLAVRVDALTDEAGPFAGTVELDVALAFRTPDTLAATWVGGLVNCHAQTIINLGYRSYGVDAIPSEIVGHASCSKPGEPVASGHVVACARVTDIEERTTL